MTATRSTPGSVNEPTLYVAFELGTKDWKLGITSGLGVAPWVRTVPAGEWPAVMRAFAQARRRFGLPESAVVVSCYEAGRDGFWIDRALTARGVRNRVVDSASIEVNRKARRAKTDRLDAQKLVLMLVRACTGEVGVWREVRVPTEADEASRHRSRERHQLRRETTRLTNQLRSVLATWGTRLPARRVGAWWTTVRDWADRALPAAVQARLARADARLAMIARQVAEVEASQRAQMQAAPIGSALQRLVQLKGVATTSASVLIDEGLIWREFRNRRQVGGLLGFAPVPYRSGKDARDQGIDRAGNTRLRHISLQLAWNWVQWQPSSALTQWFRQQFGAGGPRRRRLGIVALARKLLIALWRYATTGRLPVDAVLKGA